MRASARSASAPTAAIVHADAAHAVALVDAVDVVHAVASAVGGALFGPQLARLPVFDNLFVAAQVAGLKRSDVGGLDRADNLFVAVLSSLGYGAYLVYFHVFDTKGALQLQSL